MNDDYIFVVPNYNEDESIMDVAQEIASLQFAIGHIPQSEQIRIITEN